KLMKKGDRALCYHGKPEYALYAIAAVTRDPYPDPHDPSAKNLVVDLRALERLPRQVTLVELRDQKPLRKVKFLKNPRLTISPLADEEYSEILRLAGIVAPPASRFLRLAFVAHCFAFPTDICGFSRAELPSHDWRALFELRRLDAALPQT